LKNKIFFKQLKKAQRSLSVDIHIRDNESLIKPINS